MADTYERAFELAQQVEVLLDELRALEPTLDNRESRGAVASQLRFARDKADALHATLTAWATSPQDT